MQCDLVYQCRTEYRKKTNSNTERMKQMSYKWFCERSQWDVILGINEITFSKNHVHLIVCNVKEKEKIFFI